MYCNTSRSAAELKEICLQCFSRHLKSRCSRRMRLLRERQSFKCCEPSNSYCGQQLLPSTGVGWPQVWWPSRSSRRVSTWKMGKGQSKKQPSSPESAGACVQCQGQKSEITSVIQTHLLPTPPCQPQLVQTLSVRFTLYLVMGQGWHQTSYSSQESASCMRLVGKGTALQLRFLMKQYSLKRKPEKIKWNESPHRVCWAKGRPKFETLFNLSTPEATAQRKLPALLLSSKSKAVNTNKMLLARISKKELKFEGNSYKLVWERQQVWCTSAAYPGTNYIFYSKELLRKQGSLYWRMASTC